MKSAITFLSICYLVVTSSLSLALIPTVYAEELFKDRYEFVNPALPTANKDKIEVLELFWYGCPHCYTFQKSLTLWEKTKAADVDFVYMPAIFNDKWAVGAQVFYALEALGIREKMHTVIFDAVHLHKRVLTDESSFTNFLVEQGVKAEDFKNAFHSFDVDSKTRRAKSMTIKYGIDGVPAIIVNGKYRLSTEKADGYDNMLKIVDYLVAKERALKAPTAAVATPSTTR